MAAPPPQTEQMGLLLERCIVHHGDDVVNALLGCVDAVSVPSRLPQPRADHLHHMGQRSEISNSSLGLGTILDQFEEER